MRPHARGLVLVALLVGSVAWAPVRSQAPGQGRSELPPKELHVCDLACVTLYLTTDGGGYSGLRDAKTPPRNASGGIWIKRFDQTGVELVRVDPPNQYFRNGLRGTISGRIAPDGNQLVDGKLTWTFGLNTSTPTQMTWGSLLDTIPGAGEAPTVQAARARQPGAAAVATTPVEAPLAVDRTTASLAAALAKGFNSASTDAGPQPPEVIEECERDVQGEVCGRWVWDGHRYRATWTDAAEAELNLVQFGERIVLWRVDWVGKFSGMTGVYSGRVSGDQVVDGKVTWRTGDRSIEGSWTARLGSKKVTEAQLLKHSLGEGVGLFEGYWYCTAPFCEFKLFIRQEGTSLRAVYLDDAYEPRGKLAVRAVVDLGAGTAKAELAEYPRFVAEGDPAFKWVETPFSVETADHLSISKRVFERVSRPSPVGLPCPATSLKVTAAYASRRAEAAHTLGDERLALCWLERSADLELDSAQLLLGAMYRHGVGVPGKDPQRALMWLKRATERKNYAAAFAVAEMFEKGEGTSPDPAQAQAWRKRGGELRRENELLLAKRAADEKRDQASIDFMLGFIGAVKASGTGPGRSAEQNERDMRRSRCMLTIDANRRGAANRMAVGDACQ